MVMQELTGHSEGNSFVYVNCLLEGQLAMVDPFVLALAENNTRFIDSFRWLN